MPDPVWSFGKILRFRIFTVILIDYELRGDFQGGMSNTKYQKMTGVGDRTALRDLSELHEHNLMGKTGQFKGRRYYLNVPRLLERL
ncbi:MAG: hypothetical protein R6U56_03385 [Opitutales bacterium]